MRGGPILYGRRSPVQLNSGMVADRPLPRRVQYAHPSAPAAAAGLWHFLCSGQAAWRVLSDAGWGQVC